MSIVKRQSMNEHQVISTEHPMFSENKTFWTLLNSTSFQRSKFPNAESTQPLLKINKTNTMNYLHCCIQKWLTFHECVFCENEEIIIKQKISHDLWIMKYVYFCSLSVCEHI